jgi:peptidoglycan/LPS O-acetylase OafA/YrhL
MNRLREIDFLRGIAILLVLLRHIPLFSFTSKFGWIGVDLFFVLSGFLVSGLLFKEYIKFGNIQPRLFLIRRGFKIYPIYFIFYVLYLIPLVINHNFNVIGFMADMTFTQNYIWGWGYAYFATWSLAVEEHFYFGFAFILWLGLKFNKNLLQININYQSSKRNFVHITISLLVIILLLRLYSNYNFPLQQVKNFTMTHLRIDSLLFGVLISYFYYFRKTIFEAFFKKWSYFLYLICLCGLIWTPFIEPVSSIFVKTFGFSALYISFGIVLTTFLLKKNINNLLNRIFSERIVNIVSKIGYCSYSIYIIHTFCLKYSLQPFHYIFSILKLNSNLYVDFLISLTSSIIAGIVMTFKIEKYFLRIRDKYYPSRV